MSVFIRKIYKISIYVFYQTRYGFLMFVLTQNTCYDSYKDREWIVLIRAQFKNGIASRIIGIVHKKVQCYNEYSVKIHNKCDKI